MHRQKRAVARRPSLHRGWFVVFAAFLIGGSSLPVGAFLGEQNPAQNPSTSTAQTATAQTATSGNPATTTTTTAGQTGATASTAGTATGQTTAGTPTTAGTATTAGTPTTATTTGSAPATTAGPAPATTGLATTGQVTTGAMSPGLAGQSTGNATTGQTATAGSPTQATAGQATAGQTTGTGTTSSQTTGVTTAGMPAPGTLPSNGLPNGITYYQTPGGQVMPNGIYPPQLSLQMPALPTFGMSWFTAARAAVDARNAGNTGYLPNSSFGSPTAPGSTTPVTGGATPTTGTISGAPTTMTTPGGPVPPPVSPGVTPPPGTPPGSSPYPGTSPNPNPSTTGQGGTPPTFPGVPPTTTGSLPGQTTGQTGAQPGLSPGAPGTTLSPQVPPPSFLNPTGPGNTGQVINPTPPARYQIGIGDQIDIKYSSPTVPLTDNPVVVDGQGYIVVPGSNIRLIARGQTLAQLQVNLERVMYRVVPNARVIVTLGPLQMITVTITGEAYGPGAYQVPSTATVWNVLYLAGGPSDNGSLRSIQLKRAGAVYNIDLYRYMIAGDSRWDLPVQPGDVINIAPAVTKVAVFGEVNRPAIYELVPGNRLHDAIRYALGPTSGAITPSILVSTTAGTGAKQGRVFQNVDFRSANSKDNPPLFNQDTVQV